MEGHTLQYFELSKSSRVACGRQLVICYTFDLSSHQGTIGAFSRAMMLDGAVVAVCFEEPRWNSVDRVGELGHTIVCILAL